MPTVAGRLNIIEQTGRRVDAGLSFVSGFSPEVDVNSKINLDFDYKSGPTYSKLMRVCIDLGQVGWTTNLLINKEIASGWYVSGNKNGLLEIENKAGGVEVNKGFNLTIPVKNPSAAGNYIPNIWLIDNTGIEIQGINRVGNFNVIEQTDRKVSGCAEYRQGYSHEAGAYSMIKINLVNDGDNPSYCELGAVSVSLSCGKIISSQGEDAGAGWVVGQRIDSQTVVLVPGEGASIKPRESREWSLRIQNALEPVGMTAAITGIEVSSARQVDVRMLNNLLIIPQKLRNFQIKPGFKHSSSNEVKAISSLELEAASSLDNPDYAVVNDIYLNLGSLNVLNQYEVGDGWYCSWINTQTLRLKSSSPAQSITPGQVRKFVIAVQNPQAEQSIFISGTAAEDIGLSYPIRICGVLKINEHIQREFKTKIDMECAVGETVSMPVVIENPRQNPE
ncbi:MAG: hypothetical protein AAB110_08775, partial [Candidatus Desantisbacteria bacterium]